MASNEMASKKDCFKHEALLLRRRFFNDLKLPYSAVRNEQLEVKAILHNYCKDPITVRVELMENGEVCSSASKKGNYSQEVNMNPMSSRVVPYVIIPMKLGMHSIEVKASVKNSYNNGDGLKRDLRVVAEGVLVKKETTVISVRWRADQCAGGAGHDGSCAAWVSIKRTTWLTVYVVKVFAMSSTLISVQEQVLCSAVKWLILHTQQPDSIFSEFALVIHAEMT
ncbi:unnamed protein product [Coregonus sp. 'balchen']|nr:unnamed protein product [Coregonus sp. 'balchen']